MILQNFSWVSSLFTSKDRSSREKTNKATEILNGTTEQLDLIYIFRTLHPKKTRIHIQVHMEQSIGLITFMAQN